MYTKIIWREILIFFAAGMINCFGDMHPLNKTFVDLSVNTHVLNRSYFNPVITCANDSKTILNLSPVSDLKWESSDVISYLGQPLHVSFFDSTFPNEHYVDTISQLWANTGYEYEIYSSLTGIYMGNRILKKTISISSITGNNIDSLYIVLDRIGLHN